MQDFLSGKKRHPDGLKGPQPGHAKVPLHIAVFKGHSEKERLMIEKMFFELLTDLPGIMFLARIDTKIVGVMRKKSCDGRKISDEQALAEEMDNPDWRKSNWLNEWARRDPSECGRIYHRKWDDQKFPKFYTRPPNP